MLTEEQIERNKQFIAALRSGKYEQTTGALRHCGSDREYSYCCLGVACDVKLSNSGEGTWVDCSFNGEYQIAPGDVVEYYGWDSGNPNITLTSGELPTNRLSIRTVYGPNGETHKTCVAAGLNDAGASFAEIADSFEKQLAIEIARTA